VRVGWCSRGLGAPPPAGPPRVIRRLEQAPLALGGAFGPPTPALAASARCRAFIFHTCLYISPFPGRASTLSGAPPSGLDVSPRTDVQRALGHSHRRGEKVLVAPVVASAVGICGLLTVGYPSIADSGGYGRCGFRLRACRAGPPPLGAVCASPLACLTACRGCLSRTSLWGIQWGQ
jgi:hypothetical protein